MRYFIFGIKSSKYDVFHLQHISVWKSHVSRTQQSHVASGPHVISTALEESHVGRERLPGPCLLPCPKYLAPCLGFHKYSMSSFLLKRLLTTFVAKERVGQWRMIVLSNGYSAVFLHCSRTFH